MSLVPFPYDVVGAWTARHNIELSKEAYEDLIEQFWTYSEKPEINLTPEQEQRVDEKLRMLKELQDITNVTKE